MTGLGCKTDLGCSVWLRHHRGTGARRMTNSPGSLLVSPSPPPLVSEAGAPSGNPTHVQSEQAGVLFRRQVNETAECES